MVGADDLKQKHWLVKLEEVWKWTKERRVESKKQKDSGMSNNNKSNDSHLMKYVSKKIL
jgi:hypothetical protein